MKNETTYTAFDLEQIAIRAACALNGELLENEAFCGYCGSKSEFDNLYLECLTLAQAAVYPSLDLILDAYWAVQYEICEGQRAVDWYL